MRKKNQKLMMELLTDNRGNCCFIGFTNFMQCTRKKNQELMMELLNDREKNVDFFCLTLSMYFVFYFGVMFYASFFSPLFFSSQSWLLFSLVCLTYWSAYLCISCFHLTGLFLVNITGTIYKTTIVPSRTFCVVSYLEILTLGISP